MLKAVEKMNTQCTENLQHALELAEQLLGLADAGDEIREDVGCGVLYGMVRDCAYKIRTLAQAEMHEHEKRAEIH